MIGELLVGFIGSSQRLEYTCIGDTVNTSSRVCSMAKQDQVLISEYTHKYVASRVDAVQVGFRQFKGKQKEVMVYEIMAMYPNGKPEKTESDAIKEVPALPEATPTTATATTPVPDFSDKYSDKA